MDTDPMKCVVEVTYPHCPDTRLDQRFECETAKDAGEWVEEFTPLDAEEVAEMLGDGERIDHEDTETGRCVTAWRVGVEVPA
jgi:hypothetical protein